MFNKYNSKTTCFSIERFGPLSIFITGAMHRTCLLPWDGSKDSHFHSQINITSPYLPSVFIFGTNIIQYVFWTYIKKTFVAVLNTMLINDTSLGVSIQCSDIVSCLFPFSLNLFSVFNELPEECPLLNCWN